MYKRKTKDIWGLEGNYGWGFEELLTEDNRQDAITRYREYRENEPHFSHRLIKKRVKI